MSGKRDKNKHTEGLPGLTALTVTLKTIKQKYMHTKSDAGSHLDSKRLKAYIQCVRKKRLNVFCTIFDKSRAILMKFGTQFSECCKVM